MDSRGEIVALAVADLDRVADIHLASFPSSFLSMLGRGAVRRYYDWQLNGPHDVVALASCHEGRMVGYCFGGLFRGALAGFLKVNRAYLAWRVVSHPWVLSHPAVRGRWSLRRLSRLIRPSAHVAAPQCGEGKPRPFGVLAIAVEPAARQLGLGKGMMIACESAARRGGFEQMVLTVHPENVGAVRFYERLGWSRHGAVESWSGSMRKELVSDGTDGLENPGRSVISEGQTPGWRA
jgi:ribosomal protein S18 acetylase RimI-like enzyme